MNRARNTLRHILPVSGAVLAALAAGACFRADAGTPSPEAASRDPAVETAVFALG